MKRFAAVLRGIVTGTMVSLVAATAVHAGGGVQGAKVTATPDSGLATGQAVQVSGSGYPKNEDVTIYQCGGTAKPVTCTYFGHNATVKADQNGNFGPVSFTVDTSFDGTQYVKNKPQPTHHDCLPKNDCWVRALPKTPSDRVKGPVFPGEDHAIKFATP
jgi:hypothetical protein